MPQGLPVTVFAAYEAPGQGMGQGAPEAVGHWLPGLMMPDS